MNDEVQKPLRDWTPARVSLQSTGYSLATSEILKLQLATAQARDAVHATLGISALVTALAQRNLPHVTFASAATSRAEYLRNPALGRTLAPYAARQLQSLSPATLQSESPSQPPSQTPSQPPSQPPYDVVFVIADGLSALAVDRHALPLLDAILPLLDASWRIAPMCIVEHARVAIADPIGELLGARASVILIGERPGLSSPDSLGVYITWHPRTGRSDAERNCISNIRPEGLGYTEAAQLLHFYLTESRRLQQSGTMLKPTQQNLLQRRGG